MKGTLTFTVSLCGLHDPPFVLFFSWLEKIFISLSLLPQTEPTYEWNKPVLPSLWAARVTLGNVGNHRLNMKYWVVVRKKKKKEKKKKYSGFHRWNVSSCGIKKKFKNLFLKKNHNSEEKNKQKKKHCSFFSAPASSSAFPTHGVIILERLSEELQGLCCGWVWEEKGGRQRFKTERRSAPEDEWGGGKASELRSGGWKGERYTTCWLILQFVAAQHEARVLLLLQN